MIKPVCYEVRDLKDETKSPCLDCKRWNKCPYGEGKSFYTYAEVRFCPYQIIWIIRHFEELYNDKWPEQPNSSNYTDSKIKTGYRSEAYFVKPRLIVAEVEKRMESTGPVGECLRHAAESHKGIWELAGPEYNVLMYLKGKKRKFQSYAQWKRGVR